MESLIKEVVRRGLISDQTPSVDIIDLDYLDHRTKDILEAFPEPFFLHAAAMKANSMRGVLRFIKDRSLGAECASISEVLHAIDLGFPADSIVFDSPCKTKYDLKLALDANVIINMDNELEMEKVDELINGECKDTKSKIGLRVNPLVGGGAIAIISTATKVSKFGLPVNPDTEDDIIELYKKYPWISGIHVHVGSQGVPLELFVNGAKVCMDFVQKIEEKCGRNLEFVDIGGGLSTTYKESEEPKAYEYSLYRRQLNDLVPELFSGKYKIITEFGRSLFLKCGKTVTRVEHVKHWVKEINPIILTHVGANQFIRETYQPDVWRHRFSLAGPDGTIRDDEDEKMVYDLAGPMCFQGDYLAKDVELAKASHGDLLIMHDTGAYTMAMYSKFNSILPSPIYGLSRDPDDETKIKMICLKERETVEDNLRFWGLDSPIEI